MCLMIYKIDFKDGLYCAEVECEKKIPIKKQKLDVEAIKAHF